MFRLHALAIVALLLILPQSAGAAAQGRASLKSDVAGYWWNRDYVNAAYFGRIHHIRYGADLHVDYMAGTAACRVREYRARGKGMLRAVLRDFSGRLIPRHRDLISVEIGKCEPAWGRSVQTYYRGRPAYVHWIGSSGAPWISPETVVRDEPVDPEGEDLSRIQVEALFDRRTTEELFGPELPAPDSLQAAPCEDDCEQPTEPPR